MGMNPERGPYPIPAGWVGAADQELAAVREEVGKLVELWRIEQARYDALGFDGLAKICAFMVEHVRSRLNDRGVIAALAVAVEQLASCDGV